MSDAYYESDAFKQKLKSNEDQQSTFDFRIFDDDNDDNDDNDDKGKNARLLNINASENASDEAGRVEVQPQPMSNQPQSTSNQPQSTSNWRTKTAAAASKGLYDLGTGASKGLYDLGTGASKGLYKLGTGVVTAASRGIERGRFGSRPAIGRFINENKDVPSYLKAALMHLQKIADEEGMIKKFLVEDAESKLTQTKTDNNGNTVYIQNPEIQNIGLFATEIRKNKDQNDEFSGGYININSRGKLKSKRRRRRNSGTRKSEKGKKSKY